MTRNPQFTVKIKVAILITLMFVFITKLFYSIEYKKDRIDGANGIVTLQFGTVFAEKVEAKYERMKEYKLSVEDVVKNENGVAAITIIQSNTGKIIYSNTFYIDEILFNKNLVFDFSKTVNNITISNGIRLKKGNEYIINIAVSEGAIIDLYTIDTNSDFFINTNPFGHSLCRDIIYINEQIIYPKELSESDIHNMLMCLFILIMVLLY